MGKGIFALIWTRPGNIHWAASIVVEWAERLMMDHNTTRVGIDDTGLGNWNLRREDERASTTEKEVDTSHTGKGEKVEEGSTQGDGGDGDS